MGIDKNISNYKVEEYTLDSVSDYSEDYGSTELNKITYNIIGAAMEVHNLIGRGFLESVYKDCLSIEFEKRAIRFTREKQFDIYYKSIKIPHHYFADFVIENEIILEVKAQADVVEGNIKQILNYMAVSKCKIGLLINFGETSLKYKRIILTS